MFKPFVTRSTNFVYVYHSGNSLESARLMGMTENAYNSCKGSYNVSAFVSMGSSLEQIMNDIDYEFTLDVKDRNIGRGVSEKQAKECAMEFYLDVRHRIQNYFLHGQEYCFLVNKEQFVGVLCKGETFDNLSFKNAIGEWVDLDLSDCDTVDLGHIFSETLKMGKEVSVSKYAGRLYNGDSKYALIGVLENGDNSIVSFQNIKFKEGSKEAKILNGLNMGLARYQLDLGKNRYWL